MWSPKIIAQLLFVLAFPFLPLLIAWRVDWWQAWVYGGVAALGFILSRVLAARRHPDLLEERVKSLDHEDTAPWDRTLAPLMALGGVLIPVAAGVEARFVEQGPFPLALAVAGIVLMIAGYALGTWAMVENRFFSGTVRIQEDRGHAVVDTGPYEIVRHPGYTGALLAYVAAPFIFNTPWTFLPVALLTVVTVVRTRLEDAFLHEHLPGYDAFAERTRSKLIPWVW